MNNASDEYVIVPKNEAIINGLYDPSTTHVFIEQGQDEQPTSLLAALLGGLIGFALGGNY